MHTLLSKTAVLLATAAALHAHAAGPTAICVDAANPPFMSLVEGKAAGVYPALIAEAFAQIGAPVKIDAKPWKRCIAEIDEGAAGVGGIYKNDERSKKYDFSEQIFVERMAVYFNKAHPVEFSGVAKLMGKKVGVVRGWSYGDEFDKAVKDGKISVEEVAADSQNFQKLNSGRVDAVLAIDEAGTSLVKSGKFPEVAKSAAYLFENPTFLAFNKSAQQTDTLAKFNKAIDDMRKNGKLGKIGSAELSK